MRKISILGNTFQDLLKVFILLLGITMVMAGCETDDGPITPIPDDNKSIVRQLSSNDNGGVIALDESSMIVPPNSIPDLSNGNEAIVSFTIESGADLPKTLPTGMDAVGPITHFGPEGFVFKKAIWLQFELPEDLAVDQVSIVGYLPDTREYGIIPMTYYDEDDRVIGATVYELGYYFLVNVEGLNRARNGQASGGFKLKNFHGNGWYPNVVELTPWAASDIYYKIIITNFVPDNPADFASWAPYNPATNGGRRYWEFMTVPNVTGWGPDHNRGLTAMGLPQGTYTAQILASHKYFQLDLPECKVYSVATTFTIKNSLTCTYFGCEGYDNGPTLPADGSWMPTDCYAYNPNVTIPVCTGEFQATLTWFNGDNGDTDLDLHLYGPDGLHIYYGNQNPGIGGIMLDRDVINQAGPVQENICAPLLSDMPRGDYEIRVDHFGGDTKNFQVRVLNGSHSTSYQGDAMDGDDEVLIHSFKLQ
jgi:hypothetical protein